MILALAIAASGDSSAQPQTEAPRQQTVPIRDLPAKPTGGGVVRGRVTAAATGQPLHRVRITLNTRMPNPPTAVTDTRGAFEVTNIPAGSYTLTAVRAGYLAIEYGQRRPREAGRTLEIREGQTLEGIDVALFRGGVLVGRILDEAGDPAPDARVEAIEYRYIRGRRVPVPARITVTNDAGDYRLSGLEPGTYQIRASTTELWESDDEKTTFVHAVTYFPGVAGTERPQTVNVSVGQEVSNLDFRLIAGRAARVTGVAEGTNGEPLAAQMVYIDRITRTVGGALQSAGPNISTRADARGAFEFPKLTAGEYMVYSGADAERVAVRVILTDGDVEHVVLTPRKGTSIAGSIVVDDGSVPPFPPTRLRVVPVAADPASVLPVWAAPREQPPRSDWKFQITNVDGEYLFRVTDLPDDWMLKAVMLGDRDMTDEPLRVPRGSPEVQDVRIVLSAKGAKLSGVVVDRGGAPAADTTVVLFAENRARWGLASRYIKATRPDNAGRFSIGGLPPAVYLAIASDRLIEGQWEDPEFLQSVLKDALRIELGEAATDTIRLVAEDRR